MNSHRSDNRLYQYLPFFVLFFLVILTHHLFSWIGFHPTEEGVDLALSRRILEGQIPHRDFITIRPVGAALLQIPLLLIGGDKVFWLNRLNLIFQCFGIAWFSLSIISRWLKLSFSWYERIFMIIVGFVLTSHNFLSLYTINGLFLLLWGHSCALKDRPLKKSLAIYL